MVSLCLLLSSCVSVENWKVYYGRCVFDIDKKHHAEILAVECDL